jgi:hypothetical protein
MALHLSAPGQLAAKHLADDAPPDNMSASCWTPYGRGAAIA